MELILKKYASNSKLEEMSNKWASSPINELVKRNGLIRGPFGGALKKECFVKKGYKIYEQKNAIYQSVELGDYYIDESKFRELKRFELNSGDFILSCSGTIGRIFRIPNQFAQGIINQALLIIRIDEGKIDPNYFYHQFVSDRIQGKVIDDTQGGAMKNLVGMPQFKKVEIPLPPTLEEQKAIATALSDVDELINTLEKFIKKKKAIKEGTMQQLLTPPEKGGKRLPGFKIAWERVSVDKVINVARGGSPRPIQDFITSASDGINWIKIGDTSSNSKYIISSEEKIRPEGAQYSRKVNVGDFLLSNSMSFGRPYILKIDGCIHDGWLVLQNYQDSFDTEFLYYTLMSRDVHNQYLMKASGSSVLNLNKEIVKTVELNRPKDIDEQRAIAKILSDMDKEIDALEYKKKKSQEIKQGMMQELLTGKTRLI